MRTFNVCGIDIAAVSPDGAARHIIEAAAAGATMQVHLCNAYTISLAGQDHDLARALAGADFNLPDGTPLAWLGRSAGVGPPVRGPGLVLKVAEFGRQRNLRHYFYGGAPGVAARAVDRLQRDFPQFNCVGLESPPFGRPTQASVKEAAFRIRSAGANVLWIGLGTPKQDHAVALFAEHLNAVIVPVGAAFDFLAGDVEEAPGWLHGSGLEWLFRLASEPKRLWRRYTVGNLIFIARVMRHRFIRPYPKPGTHAT